jgi:iron uptake system component EfeO
VRRTIAVLLAMTPLIAIGTACGDDGASSVDGVRTIEVTLTDEACEPLSISAGAGPTTFHVTNDGAAGVTEFEILSGTKILGEVENVASGLDRKFSLTLKPGSYTTYCPGAKKEKGTLEVAESGTGQTGDPVARKAAVDAYLTYVKAEADQLIIDTVSFTQAVKAGDLTSAKARFATSRSHFETIEPIAESFGDLDPKIDAREGDVPDAEWTGFHRIEKALWVDNSAAGLGELADKLLADVKSLREQIDTIELEPAQIANGAVELLNEVSASKITGEEDRYSHTDLYDFEANVAGSKAAFEAVKALLDVNDATLSSTIDQRFVDVSAALAPFKTGTIFVDYTKLTDADKTTLSQKVDALAEPLSKVAALVLR